MVVAVEKMIGDVRVAMDMNRSAKALVAVGDKETLLLDELIQSKLLEGIRITEMEAPVIMLESGHDLSEDGNLYIGKDGKGFVVLPEDFMRLICFRMSDWKRAVFTPITPEDPLYAQQSSRFKGICGNTEKPVVALVKRQEGKVLEFYSSRDSSATIVQSPYLPMPKIDEYGGIDVSEDCYESAVCRTAYLVLTTLGDSLADKLLGISRSMINIQ